MSDKDKLAKQLAAAHKKVEPRIERIVRVIADREQDASEPVKLLEINPLTPPSGIVPIAFGADPPRTPFPSVVIEVTEAEFRNILERTLELPYGWRLGETLYPVAHDL